jgi:hypothetical protein
MCSGCTVVLYSSLSPQKETGSFLRPDQGPSLPLYTTCIVLYAVLWQIFSDFFLLQLSLHCSKYPAAKGIPCARYHYSLYKHIYIYIYIYKHILPKYHAFKIRIKIYLFPHQAVHEISLHEHNFHREITFAINKIIIIFSY